MWINKILQWVTPLIESLGLTKTQFLAIVFLIMDAGVVFNLWPSEFVDLVKNNLGPILGGQVAALSVTLQDTILNRTRNFGPHA